MLSIVTEPSLFAQRDTVAIDSTNYNLATNYMKKSKNQKTIGWIMVGAGTALIIAGAVTNSSSSDIGWESLNKDINQGILIASGSLVGIGSIPLFLASSKNRKKAEIYLKPANTINYIQQKPVYTPQLGLVVRF
mgnify:CR=1 FL=1